MRTVLTAEEMRALEAECFRRGVQSIDAMERAAAAVADELLKRLQPRALVYFACGPGMNGGDGYAAARLYAQRGGRAVVIPIGEEARLTGDALTNCVRAHETPRVWFRGPEEAGERPDAWVDALFGIGLKRPLEGAAARLSARMAADRRAGSLVFAVDIPSGLDATTGRPLGTAVGADVTVTFEHLKAGHILSAGPEYCGGVGVRPVGLEGDVPGAALIAARAAQKCGVGLMTIACPESIVPILQLGAPAATCLPLSEENGAISERALPALRAALDGATAVAIGPGLSRRAHPGTVRLVLESGLPAVADADALNLIAENPDLVAQLRPRHVLTPHPGEAARLIGEKPENLIEGARRLRALGAAAILKGPTSAIAGERVYLSASGTPGMARGGSGDALTGILGALLAQRIEPEKAAWVADELHGLAGEAAAKKFGEVSMGPMDLVDCLGEVVPLAR